MTSLSFSSSENIERRNSRDQKRKKRKAKKKALQAQNALIDLQEQQQLIDLQSKNDLRGQQQLIDPRGQNKNAVNNEENKNAVNNEGNKNAVNNAENKNAVDNQEILKLIIQISIIMIALGVSIRYYYVLRIKDKKDNEEELDNIKDSTEIHRNVMSTFFYFCIIIFLSLFMIYVSIQVTIAADSLKGLDNNVYDIKNDPMDLISKIKFEELLKNSFDIDMNNPNEYIKSKFDIDIKDPNKYISKRFGTFSLRNIRKGHFFIKNVVVKKIGKRHIRIQAGNEIEKIYKNVIEKMNNKEESGKLMGYNLIDLIKLLTSPIDYGSMVELQQNRSEESKVFNRIVPIKRDLIIFVFYCVDAFERKDLEQIVEKIGERVRNQQEPDLFTLHENELPKRIEEQQKNRQNYQKLQVIIKQRKQKRQGDPRKLLQGNRILGIQGVQQREQQDSDSSASFQTISNNNNSIQQKMSVNEQYQIQNNSNSGG